MPIGMRQAGDGASEADLQELEKDLEAKLPEDYRTFLLRHNGGKPKLNNFSIPQDNNASGVNRVLSIPEIREERRIYGSRLPSDMLPVALAEGGNLVCIALKSGKVFFWDHELEHRDPFFLLAEEFQEFWDNLEQSDPDSVELKPGQVKSAWIDPELLK